jgi:hypothetical protein
MKHRGATLLVAVFLLALTPCLLVSASDSDQALLPSFAWAPGSSLGWFVSGQALFPLAANESGAGVGMGTYLGPERVAAIRATQNGAFLQFSSGRIEYYAPIALDKGLFAVFMVGGPVKDGKSLSGFLMDSIGAARLVSANAYRLDMIAVSAKGGAYRLLPDLPVFLPLPQLGPSTANALYCEDFRRFLAASDSGLSVYSLLFPQGVAALMPREGLADASLEAPSFPTIGAAPCATFPMPGKVLSMGANKDGSLIAAGDSAGNLLLIAPDPQAASGQALVSSFVYTKARQAEWRSAYVPDSALGDDALLISPGNAFKLNAVSAGDGKVSISAEAQAQGADAFWCVGNDGLSVAFSKDSVAVSPSSPGALDFAKIPQAKWVKLPALKAGKNTVELESLGAKLSVRVNGALALSLDAGEDYLTQGLALAAGKGCALKLYSMDETHYDRGYAYKALGTVKLSPNPITSVVVDGSLAYAIDSSGRAFAVDSQGLKTTAQATVGGSALFLSQSGLFAGSDVGGFLFYDPKTLLKK